ncbi:hypothetical protein TD95_000321 [Thielaviopsis punctulata]|uniref:ER membrane protein complex subunit 2 n=1 Tax=Thielaviopsis punctulata TaxID=72032 RepID=A0A0F4Z662_9PEZI|nr:hypothetical protein TD95_000321 [Thielaviopsis punctulata]
MTSPTLVWPHGLLSPAESLEIAQQAPKFIHSKPISYSTSPLSVLLGTTESPDVWASYENLLIACLRTGDDESAQKIIERLTKRFGDSNERVMALQGLVKEAKAESEAELDAILNGYLDILRENEGSSLNIPIAKRRIALARSLGRVSDAISYAVKLLEVTPTDAEAWSELGDMYLSQGLYGQAIYALEEVLILAPNAWNMYARLAEVQFMAGTAKGTDPALAPKYLAESLKRFCRSIELCDNYLRGYYGLKTVTDYFIKEPVNIKAIKSDDSITLPDARTINKLNETATAKLAEIVRRFSANESGWTGYKEAEVAAAKALLEGSEEKVVR